MRKKLESNASVLRKGTRLPHHATREESLAKTRRCSARHGPKQTLGRRWAGEAARHQSLETDIAHQTNTGSCYPAFAHISSPSRPATAPSSMHGPTQRAASCACRAHHHICDW